MVFDGEYFQQIFGLIMGTNVAPILTNIYMAMLENELKMKCEADPKLIWPVLFKRFIDDGFGITKGDRKDVIYWIQKFNELRKTVQLTNITGGMLLIIWTFSCTKAALFTWMANFQSLFIKKRPTSSCPSLFDLSTKNIPSKTLSGAN